MMCFHKGSLALLAIGLIMIVSPVFAETSSEETQHNRGLFDLGLKQAPHRPRNAVLPAAVSLILPGFDQWGEAQYGAAAFYSGMALIGYQTYAYNLEQLEHTDELDPAKWYDSDSDRLRRIYWGAQFTQTMGGLSAYHSFRTAVRSHNNAGTGKYDFLPHEETSGDLMLAPLKFQYLLRPTTFIPLGLLAVAIAIDINQTDRESRDPALTTSEGVFSTAVSYNAGVGEEAIFRGWLMPVFRQSMGSDLWSNTLTAALFAATHISGDLQVPLAQFAMGWYWGWVTQKNEWRISEAVFQHVWWDVIVLSAVFMTDSTAEVTVPVLTLSF